eukprot:4105493-Pyramimonas_sp.AAC.1
MKSIKFRGGTRLTDSLRPSNGRGGPGIRCSESLHPRVTDLMGAGAPGHFMRGTRWAHIPSILNV